MRVIKLQIAGQTLSIHANSKRLYNMCRGFISTKDATLSLIVSEEEFENEREEYLNRFGVLPSQIQTEIMVYLRKVADALIAYNTFLIHGASIAICGNAYMFSAKSGTGKTTHILKWLANSPSAYVINGDKSFVKINDDGTVFACGSPWSGKENLCTNTMEPLKSIILMERSENNYIEQITFAEAFPVLLQQVYRPNDEEKMRKTLRLMQQLNGTVSFWRFKCNNFKDDCFETAYNALVREH